MALQKNTIVPAGAALSEEVERLSQAAREAKRRSDQGDGDAFTELVQINRWLGDARMKSELHTWFVASNPGADEGDFTRLWPAMRDAEMLRRMDAAREKHTENAKAYRL